MNNPSKILVIQLKRAGDVVVTTPVFGALRRLYPQAQIDFLTEKAFAPLVSGHPDLHQTLAYDRRDPWAAIRRVRGERYDWIVDFQSSPRSALLCLLSGAGLTAGFRVPFWGRVYKKTVRRPGGNLSVVDGKFTLIESLAGPAPVRPDRKIYLTEPELDWARQAMPAVSSRRIIGVVPTHRRNSRRWPAESFSTLARRFLQDGNEVWLFWGPGEEDYVRAIEQAAPGAKRIPPTSLRQMAALLARCRIVVTNDNGPMHLAVAAGAPTVTIYGPTNPLSWNPGGPNHAVVQAADVPCLGCNLNECPFSHECMTHVTPETVWQRAEALLGSKAVS